MPSDARGMASGIAVGLAAGLAPAAAAQFAFSTLQDIQFDLEFYPTAIAAGDVDLDGAPDLVVSGRNREGLIALLPGLGDGTFEPEPILVELGNQSNWIALRDMDLDGRLDILVANRTRPAAISILRGNGDGTFQPREDVGAGREPVVILAEDLDGDGDCDVVGIDSRGDAVEFFSNDGSGTLLDAGDEPLGRALFESARPFASVLGDLDGDGRRDVASVHLASGHVSLLRNESSTGAIEFGPALRRPVGAVAGVAAVDRDGDGDEDLLMGRWGELAGTLVLLDNDGTGGFTETTWSSFGVWLWDLATADLDGDGTPDAIVSDAFESTLFFLRGTGGDAPAFEEAQFLLGIGFSFPRFVLPMDVDGDCAIDLVVADIATHRIRTLRNETPQAPGCAAADLDGDGAAGWSDLVDLLGWFGTGSPRHDLDRDGRVDVYDLLRIAEAWTP